jgi:hypothetical protein
LLHQVFGLLAEGRASTVLSHYETFGVVAPPLAKDLICAMLHPDPSKRPTLQHILAHPWVQAHSQSAPEEDLDHHHHHHHHHHTVMMMRDAGGDNACTINIAGGRRDRRSPRRGGEGGRLPPLADSATLSVAETAIDIDLAAIKLGPASPLSSGGVVSARDLLAWRGRGLPAAIAGSATPGLAETAIDIDLAAIKLVPASPRLSSGVASARDLFAWRGRGAATSPSP